jgi:hypothetical protein
MRAFLFLALASCTHDIAVFDQTEVRPARDLDILYVFDDSSDRGTYDAMTAQLDTLQARLMEIDGQLPSLHVGVVTTDLGTRGALDSVAGPQVGNCRGEGKAGQLVSFDAGITFGGFLEDLRGPGGSRIRNFASDDLTLELRKLTNPQAGTANTGCEFEQPLEAMRRALDPNVNPGFIRPGAMLQVVFLSTEDDCSISRGAMLDPNDGTLGPLLFRCTSQGVVCDTDGFGTLTGCQPREGSDFMVDVSEYQEFLTQLKPDPADVIVSAVAGPRDPFEVRDVGGPVLMPSCQGPGGAAWPAVRLGAMVDAFGGALVEGCTQDAAYAQITAPIIGRQRSCLPNLRRADGETCEVIEFLNGGQTLLPRCADGNSSPCWYTIEDASSCPEGENLGIAVNRANTTASPNSRVEARCFVQ